MITTATALVAFRPERGRDVGKGGKVAGACWSLILVPLWSRRPRGVWDVDPLKKPSGFGTGYDGWYGEAFCRASQTWGPLLRLLQLGGDAKGYVMSAKGGS